MLSLRALPTFALTTLALSTIALLLPTSDAAAAPRRNPRGTQVPPASITSGGTTWERMPVRYVDVRVIAAALGAPVLPTEWDVWRMRMGGGGIGGGFGGGGFGGGMGGGLMGNPADNSLIMGPQGQFRGAFFADPSTNALYYRYGPSR